MWAFWGTPSDADRRSEAWLRKRIPHPEVCHSLSRYWSLYTHLQKYPPNDAIHLCKQISVDAAGSIPLFTTEIAQRVVDLWPIVHSPRQYVRYVKDRIGRARHMKGGQATPATSDTETLDKFADYAIATVSDKVLPPSGQGTIGTIRAYVEYILTLPTKIIPWLEANPYIGGAYWKDAIDLFLEVAPRFILAEEFIVTAIATPLVPLFGIGIVVEVIGFVIAEVLAMLTFLLSLSMGKKGSAFLNFLQLVPFLGPLLRLGAVNVTQIYDKLAEKKDFLVKIPVAGRFAQRIFPDALEPPTPTAETPYTETPAAIQDEPRGGRRHQRTRKQSKSMDRPRRRSKATRRTSA